MKTGDFEIIQNNFSGGIVSPQVQARTDLGKTGSACSDVLNMIQLPEGGLIRRPGFSEVFDFNELILKHKLIGKCKLIPFIYNNDDACVLGFMNNKMFAIRKNGDEFELIGNTLDTPFAYKDLDELSYHQSFDVVFVASNKDVKPIMIKRVEMGKWKVDNYSFKSMLDAAVIKSVAVSENLKGDDIELVYYVCGVDGGGNIGNQSAGKNVKIKSIWEEGASININYDPLPDTNEYNIYKCIDGGKPGYIGVATGLSFRDNNITPDVSRSFRRGVLSIISKSGIVEPAVISLAYKGQFNSDNIQLNLKQSRPKADCGSVVLYGSGYPASVLTINASKRVKFISVTIYFDDKIYNSDIDTFCKTCFPDVIVTKDYTKNSVNINRGMDGLWTSWDLDLFINTTSFKTYYISGICVDYEDEIVPVGTDVGFRDNEFPVVSSIYQQRFVFANSKKYPTTLFFSKTGLIKDFSTSSPVRDDDAIEIEISTVRGEEILHLIAMDELHIFTSSGEYVCSGGDGALTPSNSFIKYSGDVGSVKSLSPITVGRDVLFVGRDQRTVKTLSYSYKDDGYMGEDLMILARHLVRGKRIVSWSYQDKPHHLFWLVLDDGSLLTLTYLKAQEVYAWSRHSIENYKAEHVVVVPDRSFDNVMIYGLNLKTNHYSLLKLNDFENADYHDLGKVFESYFETLDMQDYQYPSQLGYKRRLTGLKLNVFESDPEIDILINGKKCNVSKKIPYDYSVNLPIESITGMMRIPLSGNWEDQMRLKVSSCGAGKMDILSLHAEVSIGDN